MKNFEVSRLQNEAFNIFLADFLQVQKEIIKNFLNGKTMQLPSALECLGGRILIFYDRFVDVAGETLATIKKKKC